MLFQTCAIASRIPLHHHSHSHTVAKATYPPLTVELCELLVPTEDTFEWWMKTDQNGLNCLHKLVLDRRDDADVLLHDMEVLLSVILNDKKRQGGKEKCKKVINGLVNMDTNWGSPIRCANRYVADLKARRQVCDMMRGACA